jgi:hypothetical protein
VIERPIDPANVDAPKLFSGMGNRRRDISLLFFCGNHYVADGDV